MIRPKRYLMKVRGYELQFGDRTLIMGVLNVTPDSFSDGGRFSDPDRAVARALELEAQGADIIDIGAESTKPGAVPVSEAEELRRLIPVLKKLEGKLTIPISVDTYKSSVAEKALEYGVAFINDPSNLTLDPKVANVVASQDAGLILNHMRGTPETWAKLGNMTHPSESVLSDLENSVNRAQKGLVDRAKIIIDPGLGFGKRGDQNYEILARLGKLRELDMPIMVGASRKAFLGQKLNDSLQQDFATAAAITGAILQGAHMVRVHKVAALLCAVQTADALLRNGPEEIIDHKEKRLFVRPSERRPYGPGEASDVRGPREFRPAATATTDASPAAEERSFDDRPVRDDRPSREDRGGGDRPYMKRPLYGERPPYQGGADRGGERPPYQGGGGGDRPYVKRPSYGGDRPQGGDRPPYRGGGDRDRPSYGGGGGDRPQRSSYGGDRPSFGGGGGDRPQRPSYGDRPSRPPYGGDRPQGGDRPPYRGGGDRDRPSYGDRPARPPYGGDRPSRPPFGGDRPSRPPYGGGGDRPSRPPYGGDRPQGGARPQGGDRPFRPRPSSDGPGDRPFRPRFPKPGGFRRD